jgi:hypothetical protein
MSQVLQILPWSIRLNGVTMHCSPPYNVFDGVGMKVNLDACQYDLDTGWALCWSKIITHEGQRQPKKWADGKSGFKYVKCQPPLRFVDSEGMTLEGCK